jgi:hypothetical protein
MSDKDLARLEARIDQAIDDLNAERSPALFEDDDQEFASLLDTARILRRLREPAWPDDGFAGTLAGSLEQRLANPDPPGHHSLPNGRATLVKAPGLVKPRRLMTLRLIAAAMIRTIGVGAFAGIIAGIIAGGISGRVVMWVSGTMYLRDHPGATTVTESSGRQVGTFTLGGTADLLFEGALFGLAGGLFYVVARRWLPHSSRLRGVIFGLVLLIALGATVIDGQNEDFQRIGTPALNIGMFASIFILFGALIVPIAEWVDRWFPALRASEPRRRTIGGWLTRVLAYLVMIGAGLLGMAAAIGIFTFASISVTVFGLQAIGIGPEGANRITAQDLFIAIAVFTLAIGAPFASALYSNTGRQITSRTTGRLARPFALLQRREMTIAVYALLAMGLLAGLGMTIYSAALILTGTS